MDLITSSWTWRQTLGVAPGPGVLVADTGDPVTAAVLVFNAASNLGDATPVLTALVPGDLIRLHPTADTGTRRDYTVTGPAVLSPPDAYGVPVDLAAQAGAPWVDWSSLVVGFVRDADAPTLPWATITDARTMWPDARTVPDDALAVLLADAQALCEAFAAPDVATDAGFASTRLDAVVFTARDAWGAYRADQGGVISYDGTAIPVRALTPSVVRRLRPDRGPMVG